MRLPDPGIVAARAELAAFRAEERTRPAGCCPRPSARLTMDQWVYRMMIERRLGGKDRAGALEERRWRRRLRWGAAEKKAAAVFERERARILRKRGGLPIGNDSGPGGGERARSARARRTGL